MSDFSERDGRELPVSMLHDMSHGDDAMSIEAQYRDGAPQEDVVLRYLDILRAKDCRELDASFASILTDFVSTGPGRLRSLSRVLNEDKVEGGGATPAAA